MKIIHLTKYYYPHLGGMENHVQLLSEELIKQKNIELKIIAANVKNKYEERTINNVKVIYLPRWFEKFSTAITPSLIKHLRKEKADIWHLHLPSPMAVISYLIAKPKGKLVIMWHSDIIKQKFLLKLYKPFLNKILKQTNIIIATSPQYVSSSPYLSKYKNKCKIIPLGIDTNYFKPTEKITTQAKKIKEKFRRKIILFVGRLIYYKGLEYLIEAMKDIDADLLIIGSGKLEKELKTKSKNHGNIHFLGKVDDLRPYYAACDIFILPSIHRSEAFGIVQMEAMAFGKPVISTKLGTGVEFINQDGKTGILVEPKNSSELKNAIIKLLNDNVLCEKLGSYAKKRVQEEFTKEIVAKKVFDIYESLRPANKNLFKGILNFLKDGQDQGAIIKKLNRFEE